LNDRGLRRYFDEVFQQAKTAWDKEKESLILQFEDEMNGVQGEAAAVASVQLELTDKVFQSLKIH